MIFEKAKITEFAVIRQFYWDLIDAMHDQNDMIGWKKGIYPTDEFLQESLEKGELFTLKDNGILYGCVILNSECNEGYQGLKWSIDCPDEDVFVPHALAVDPAQQGKGLGAKIVHEIFDYARKQHKKAVRLDILGTNAMAERLYTKCGFQFVEGKNMFYEDTGWTEYKMYEYNL